MALERADIVRAAIEILDEEGLDGVTTRRIARRLDIAGPSLYWHFRNKRELLDHMAEHVLAETMPSPDPDVYAGTWQTWLAEGARAIRRAALSHRDGARLISGSKPTGTHPIMNLPAMITRLQDCGFTRAEAGTVIMVLGRYALGWALDEQNAAGGHVRTPSSRLDAGFEFGLEAIMTGIEAKTTQARTGSERQRRVP